MGKIVIENLYEIVLRKRKWKTTVFSYLKGIEKS